MQLVVRTIYGETALTRRNIEHVVIGMRVGFYTGVQLGNRAGDP